MNAELVGVVPKTPTLEIIPLKIVWDEPLLLVVFSAQGPEDDRVEEVRGTKKANGKHSVQNTTRRSGSWPTS